MAGNKKKGDSMKKNPIGDLKKYREFLETIPLDKYREEFKDIKWVEQDLHQLLLPLPSIFENYWEKQNYLNFTDWFNNFWVELTQNQNKEKKYADLKELVRAHRKFYEDIVNNNLDSRVFLGFKARMYRTWISILTQLDFCYMFVYVCNKLCKNLPLECSAELDMKGVDARVGKIEFHVAKMSERKEARGKKRKLTILYPVFEIDELKRKLESPRVSDNNKQRYKRMLKSFSKYFILLQNGFVVFNENYLKPIIDSMDNIEKVRKAVEQISLELSGKY